MIIIFVHQTVVDPLDDLFVCSPFFLFFISLPIAIGILILFKGGMVFGIGPRSCQYKLSCRFL